jgi:hypothetical protein
MLLNAKEEFFANNIPSHPWRKTGSQGSVSADILKEN